MLLTLIIAFMDSINNSMSTLDGQMLLGEILSSHLSTFLSGLLQIFQIKWLHRWEIIKLREATVTDVIRAISEYQFEQNVN